MRDTHKQHRTQTHSRGVLRHSGIKQSFAAEVPPVVQDVLASPGQPLGPEALAFMEPRFGHDFSQVRVHADARAARAAGSIGASAFTVGQDIVFGARQYAPSTREGRHLLAHELTHVAQQGYSPGRSYTTAVGSSNDASEREASRSASQVTSGNIAMVSEQASVEIQRSPGWSTDTLEIRFEPQDPKTPPQENYTENGFLSQRMSSKLPNYRGPFCQNVTLPFKCLVEFRVDYQDEPRPQPFTPPQVSVQFDFKPPKGGFSISKSDNNPTYAGQDLPLTTNFGTRFDLSLDDNGPFRMQFKLHDPDTGITRLYDDTINVEAKRPCM